MVRFRQVLPGERLRPFVHAFWLLEQEADAVGTQRIVPDGRPELILNWRQPCEYLDGIRWLRQPPMFLAGQMDRPLLLRPGGSTRAMGVSFRPNGAAALLNMPMGELTGRFTPLDELDSHLSRRLSRVYEASDPITAIEEALLPAGSTPRRTPDWIVQEAVQRISSAPVSSGVARLARDLGISARQFERRFAAQVGLSPRAFSRIIRFRRVFRFLERPRANWAQTAADCGYYDQSHLIHDCQTLAGTTPRILFARDGDLARHFYMSHSYNSRSANLR